MSQEQETIEEEMEQQYAIWHKDEGLTSTPEFVGTEDQVIEEWGKYYSENTASLDYCITLAEDREIECCFDIVYGSSAEEEIRYILCVK